MNVKQIIKILLNVSVRSGGEGFCLSQKMLQKHVLLAKAGFDIGENEPHDFLGALLGDSCPPPRSCSSCRRSARLLLLSSRSRLRFKVAVGEHTRAPRAERSCAERFRGESEKESEKPKVITENEPSMDEPTTTTVGIWRILCWQFPQCNEDADRTLARFLDLKRTSRIK